MAFDGIVTRAEVSELRAALLLGKIDKVYQPSKETLVFTVHTRRGNKKLFASASSFDSRVHLIENTPSNPTVPFAFCMLLRKHLSGGRIVSVEQHGAERIIEISLETLSELGFVESKKLIFEIMGRHSNIILVDISKNTVIDSIKRVSIDTSRVRQILPGKTYEYPPEQDKIPFDVILQDQLYALPDDPKAVLSAIGGISPAFAAELAVRGDRYAYLHSADEAARSLSFIPHIYYNGDKAAEYHIADLSEFELSCERRDFPSLSACIDVFFEGRRQTNRTRQSSHQLTRTVKALLDKAYLKKQRLSDDILEAEDSEYLRLYGELLTASIHSIEQGADRTCVTNYYDGSLITIPLDPRFSPARNAQLYYKRYGKAKTAAKEKNIQLDKTQSDIDYLESVMTFLENIDRPEDVEMIRRELVDEGYLRKRKTKYKERRFKAAPARYVSPSGFDVLVGRNNRENDELTLKIADRRDIWLHTKDIPGSHVILRTGGRNFTADDIYYAAGLAAWNSKARASSNVPVDWVSVRRVKKPSGAKPGMVIFTGNKTVYVDPHEK